MRARQEAPGSRSEDRMMVFLEHSVWHRCSHVFWCLVPHFCVCLLCVCVCESLCVFFFSTMKYCTGVLCFRSPLHKCPQYIAGGCERNEPLLVQLLVWEAPLVRQGCVQNFLFCLVKNLKLNQLRLFYFGAEKNAGKWGKRDFDPWIQPPGYDLVWLKT